MNTATIFIKTEPKVKEEAQKTAGELGFSSSSILNAYLRQFVKTETISFSAKELDEVTNEYFKQAIKKRERIERKEKDHLFFTDEKELIKKDSQKYQHIDTMLDWLHKQGV